MKKITDAADMYIAAMTECPNCKEDIDLMSIEALIEEGELYLQILGCGIGGENLELDFDCPECGAKLRTETVVW